MAKKMTKTQSYSFVHIKPKGLKKLPKKPKKTASLATWERYYALCEQIKQYNEPILKRYIELDKKINCIRG